jgi:hypothetical protein
VDYNDEVSELLRAFDSKKQRTHDNMPDAGSLITRCVADIPATPIRWLWPGRIPRGKLTVIAGHPGLGKSQISVSVTATVTTGGNWPAGGERYSIPGQVLILTAEDDASDTLRPRLEVRGAELRRVHIVDGVRVGYRGDRTGEDRLFCLESDLHALEKKLSELANVALVIIDPISAYFGTEVDTHRNSEVRAVLAPLSDLAGRHGVAIVGVSHLTKQGGNQALLRVSGSLPFVAAARSAFLVTKDPQDKSRRLFPPIKNNLGKDEDGFAYRIEEATASSPDGPIKTSYVAWEDKRVDISADEALTMPDPEETSCVREAMDWLTTTLAYGSMPAKEIIPLAKEVGIAERTLRRARETLGIQPEKEPGKSGVWIWVLPGKGDQGDQDVQDFSLGKDGHLGSDTAKVAKDAQQKKYGHLGHHLGHV